MSEVAFSKPIIGLNMDYASSHNPINKTHRARSAISAGSYNAVIRSGGIPLLIPPLSCESDLERVLDILDGIVLVGGADLDCRNDAFHLHPSMRIMDPLRERFDRRLVRLVSDRKMPVLGIGAGMQLLNVALGGALSLHIPEDYPKAISHIDTTDPLHRHALVVEKGSLMERVYGKEEICVNSTHHMAVDDVAPGFIVTAKCPDGIIEAIEWEHDDWFAVGVQFHPESESATMIDAMIFDEFIAGVQNHAALKELAV